MCRILALEKSSLSRNLKRLISSDFIFKTSKGELRITEAGKSKLETVIPSWEKAKSEIAIILGTRGQHALDLIINHIAKP
jgi:DNA-binding MarR family transcriptional regulator